MKSDVAFSIIIPTYNRANFIEKTIQSALDQTFLNFEVIVVDDGSTDNTEIVVSQIKDSRLFYHKKENAERGAARNYGRKLAKGFYITFFDSDDLLYPNHLETAWKIIQKYNSPEWLHLGYEIITPQNKLLKSVNNLAGDLNRSLINGNFLSCNSIFIRNDIAEENPFNEDRSLSALEDWELWLRMASKYKIHNCKTVTSAIINHDLRSVLETQTDKLINRVNSLMKYVLTNSEVTTFYKKDFHKFKASCFTYIALHIALTKKDRLLTVKYLLKGIVENPNCIFTRRFLATIKHFA